MMPRNPLLASALGLAVLVGSLANGRAATAQDGFGTIKGRLVWADAELPNLPAKVEKGNAAVANADVCAKDTIPDEKYVVDPKTKGVADGYAYLANVKGANPEAEKELLAKTPNVVIDQKGCRFIPHAVALHKGQTLLFKSSDPIGHNIHYTGFNIGSFNQMVAANKSLPVTFAKSDRVVVPLVCDIHPWMSGSFMVFDHPFFAVTKPNGTFEITGVPVGKQNLIVRHQAVGFVTPNLAKGIEVEVKPGKVTDVGEIKLTPKK
jgi:plastocyanin